MNPLISLLTILFCIAVINFSCTKSADYSVADHTVGMTGMKTWSGAAYGYFKGDTVLPGDTAHVVWANSFNRTITDTSFAIQKINGFMLSALGTPLDYLNTDSITTKTVVFDSILSTGAAVSNLTFNYITGIMTLQLHIVSGYNSSASQYYQENVILTSN